jgi:prevent-host-death family protein
MKTVNTHEAKTRFSELLRLVSDGEEVIIANRGVPVARIVPLCDTRSQQQGKYRGQIAIADDFDAPLPESLQRLFEGESDQGKTGEGEV